MVVLAAAVLVLAAVQVAKQQQKVMTEELDPVRQTLMVQAVVVAQGQ
jgi:hypothetical protein